MYFTNSNIRPQVNNNQLFVSCVIKCINYLSKLFISFSLQVEQLWDDVPTKPEIESKPNELRIPDILTKVATDANEGNRYVVINLINVSPLNSKNR